MKLKMFSAAIVASLVLIPAFSSAALNAYMTIKGTKQGMFKGSGPRDGDQISVRSVRYSVQSSRDPHTGQASGKRQHKPLVIVKEVDAASPQLMRAQSENEVLTEVKIEFYEMVKGKRQLHHTMTLLNATIEHITKRMAMGGHGTEEITLAFQKMETKNGQGKVTAADAWDAK